MISESGLQNLIEVLIKCYKDEDTQNIDEMIKNLAKEYKLWAVQAFEILSFLRDKNDFEKCAAYLFNNIADRHARFFVASHFNINGSVLPSKFKKFWLFVDISRKMSDGYYFSFWNPNG